MSLRHKTSFDAMDSGNVVDFPTVEKPDSDTSPSGLGSLVSKEEYNVLQLFTGNWFQMNKALFIKLFCQSGLTANELAVASAVVMLTYGRKKPEKASRISIDDIYIIADLTHVRIRQIVSALIKRNILFRDGELLGLNKFYSLWLDKNGNSLFQKNDKNDVHKSEHSANVHKSEHQKNKKKKQEDKNDVHKSEHETDVQKSEHQCSDLRTPMFTKVNILEDDSLYTKDSKDYKTNSSDNETLPPKNKKTKNNNKSISDDGFDYDNDLLSNDCERLFPKNVKRLPEEWIKGAELHLQQKGLYSPKGVNIDAETFVNHWLSNRKAKHKKTDWKRTWVNWYLNNSRPIQSQHPAGRINRQAELEQQNVSSAMSWAEKKHAAAVAAAKNGDQKDDSN